VLDIRFSYHHYNSIGEWHYLIRPYLSVGTKQRWSSYKTHRIAGWYFFMTIVSPPFTCFWICQFLCHILYSRLFLTESCEWRSWVSLVWPTSSAFFMPGCSRVFPVRELFLLVLRSSSAAVSLPPQLLNVYNMQVLN
jgi:hypothetical protein